MKLRALAPLAIVALVACGGGATSPGGTSGDGEPLPAGLTPADIARKLSLFLWNAAPDDDLVGRVYAEPPATTGDVRRLATAMVADPRARDGARAFFHQYLRLDRLGTARKDPAHYPEYTPALRDAMIAEAEAFAVHVTFDGDGRFPTLLTADFSMLNETLAPLYGVPGITGPELRKVSLDRARRAGLFTLAAVLASGQDSEQPSLSSRGAFVLSLVGREPPPEPPGLPMPPPPPDCLTMRAALEMTVGASAACAACHKLMDPPGYAFGHYDALGRYQETENGLPIDATGVWDGGGDLGFSFDGARELADKLASRTAITDAFVAKWFAFAGAKPDAGATLAAIDAFASSTYDIRSLVVAVAASPAFFAR